MSVEKTEQAGESSLAQQLDLDPEHYKELYWFATRYFQGLLPQDLAYPKAEVLQHVKNQKWIYYNMFDPECALSSMWPSTKHQKQVLKKLIEGIESAVSSLPDGEAEIFDNLAEYLARLQTIKDPQEIDSVQQSTTISYRIPSDIPGRGEKHNPFIYIKEKPLLISGNGTTGGRTWPAALHLGTYLSREGLDLVRGKRVLELGAGTGLLSILCGVLGATMVLATDGNMALTDSMYYDNIMGNTRQLGGLKHAFDKEFDGAKCVQSQVIDWSSYNSLVDGLRKGGLYCPDWIAPDDTNGGVIRPDPVDLVLGADIIYDPESTAHLVATLVHLLTAGVAGEPPPKVLLAATVRNLATVEGFRDLCLRAHLRVFDVPFQCPKPEDQTGLFHSHDVPVRLLMVERNGHSTMR